MTSDSNRMPCITYLRDTNGFPVACLAYSRDGNTLRYGMSVFNPVDRFRKEIGRDLAIGRFFGMPREFSVNDFAFDGKASLSLLFREMLTAMSNDKNTPARVRSAAKSYLKYQAKKVGF